MDNENKYRKWTKLVVSNLAAISTGATVSMIVRNNVGPATGTGIVLIPIGTFVLNTMASAAAKSYTDDKIDDLFDALPEPINVVTVVT